MEKKRLPVLVLTKTENFFSFLTNYSEIFYEEITLIKMVVKSKETESKSWIHYSLMGFEDKCITFNQEKQFYM